MNWFQLASFLLGQWSKESVEKSNFAPAAAPAAAAAKFVSSQTRFSGTNGNYQLLFKVRLNPLSNLLYILTMKLVLYVWFLGPDEVPGWKN